MDIDVLKCASGDHIDLATMMLEMDQKLPAGQFSNPYESRTPLFSDFSPTPNLGVSPATSSFFNPIFGNPLILEPAMTQTTTLQLPPSLARAKLKNSSGALSAGNLYDKRNSTAAMREMIFRIAAMQPIHIDPESIKPPKRRNVRISKDPQSVAARHRRERISERIRILQRLVPGGTKMDTASMLDEAVHYVKFLKKQVQALEQAGVGSKLQLLGGLGFSGSMIDNNNNTSLNCAIMNYSSALLKACQQPKMVGSLQMH